MKHIRKLKRVIPIQINGITLRFIKTKDIDWYVDNISQDYYTEYQEYPFKEEYRSWIQDRLKRISLDIIINKSSTDELRLVLEDIKHNKIGGCSLEYGSRNELNVSYFIIPTEQHKGYAKQMVLALVEALQSIGYCSNLYADVRSDNTASIKLLESIGFRLLSSMQGDTGVILKYGLVIK